MQNTKKPSPLDVASASLPLPWAGNIHAMANMHLPLAKWTFLSPHLPLQASNGCPDGPGGAKPLQNEAPVEFNFRHIPLGSTVLCLLECTCWSLLGVALLTL